MRSPADGRYLFPRRPTHAAERSPRRSRRFGFQGASCVHPKIVGLLNEEFRPTLQEIENARKIITAFEKAVAAGRASLEVDGKMVDYPVVYRAENLLATAENIREREESMMKAMP